MRSKTVLIAPLVLALTLLLTTPASALFLPSNGQAATLVLGQPDFTSNSASLGPTGMSSPASIAVDPTSGKVFAADTANFRVLRFADVAALSDGAPAEAVLGQPDFTTAVPHVSQSGMGGDFSSAGPGFQGPSGVAVDAGGRLWVADPGNNRVLRFDNAATKANGANADGVLGEPDFTSGDDTVCGASTGATASHMCTPMGVAVDASGRLWVADSGNHRVLRFDKAASKPNGAKADGVLGPQDFTTKVSSTLADDYALTVDANGRLWVSDLEWQQVLRFDNAASKPNGAAPDGELGTGSTTCSQNTLNHPFGVAVDSNGRLYVADMWNGRIMVFSSAASLPNGANASFVLGEPDFTTCSGPLSAASLSGPQGVFFDPAAKVLWAADSGNARVLMYGQPYAKLQILPFIGLVHYFLPPGVTPIGSISVEMRDGSIRTFDVTRGTKILPARSAGQLGQGAFVTLLARLDPTTDHWIASQIVIHAAGAPPSFPTEIPVATATPAGVPTPGP